MKSTIKKVWGIVTLAPDEHEVDNFLMPDFSAREPEEEMGFGRLLLTVLGVGAVGYGFLWVYFFITQ